MRHRGPPKHRRIVPWPDEVKAPAEVAAAARYVGSPEHKGSWSPLYTPSLRSDAAECPPELSRSLDENTRLLRQGIEAGCVGADFEDGFPRYVWVWVGETLYEARHMRGPAGTYKAYPLEPLEHPKDPESRLARDASDAS